MHRAAKPRSDHDKLDSGPLRVPAAQSWMMPMHDAHVCMLLVTLTMSHIGVIMVLYLHQLIIGCNDLQYNRTQEIQQTVCKLKHV